MLISLGCIRLNCEDIPVDAGWEIPLEVWYRATDGYRGQEFDTSTQDVVSFAPPIPGSFVNRRLFVTRCPGTVYLPW